MQLRVDQGKKEARKKRKFVEIQGDAQRKRGRSVEKGNSREGNKLTLE